MTKYSDFKLIFENFKEQYIDNIYDIEKRSIDEGWSKQQLRGLISAPNAIARVGLLDGDVVCSYSLYVIGEEGFVNNLSVEDKFRGRGIGSLLMQDMIDCANSRNVSALTLEVNENNVPAINLYKKYGFAIEGKRPRFYNGKDTALIMWRRDM